MGSVSVETLLAFLGFLDSSGPHSASRVASAPGVMLNIMLGIESRVTDAVEAGVEVSHERRRAILACFSALVRLGFFFATDLSPSSPLPASRPSLDLSVFSSISGEFLVARVSQYCPTRFGSALKTSYTFPVPNASAPPFSRSAFIVCSTAHNMPSKVLTRRVHCCTALLPPDLHLCFSIKMISGDPVRMVFLSNPYAVLDKASTEYGSDSSSALAVSCSVVVTSDRS